MSRNGLFMKRKRELEVDELLPSKSVCIREESKDEVISESEDMSEDKSEDESLDIIEEMSEITLEDLSVDVLLFTAQYLSIKDLSALMQTNRFFYKIANDPSIWNRISNRLGIRSNWHPELNDDLRLKVNTFFTISSEINRIFPPELIEVFGLSKFAQFPTIDPTMSSRRGQVTPQEMGEHAIAWAPGCICFKYVSEGHLYSEILLHPPSNLFGQWMVKSRGADHCGPLLGDNLKRAGNYLTPAFLNHLKRVIGGEEIRSRVFWFRPEDDELENRERAFTLYKPS